MNAPAFDLALSVNRAHGSLALKLDDELGTLHGLAFHDFVLLHLLSAAPEGRLPLSELMQPLGERLPALIRRLLPLEKTGHVRREAAAAGGARLVSVTPAGRTLARHARVTAEAVCADATHAWEPARTADVGVALAALSASAALKL